MRSDKLPITCKVAQCTHFREHWYAVAGLKVIAGSSTMMIRGTGCNRDSRIAKRAAEGELHERLWSSLSLHSNDLDLSLTSLDDEPMGHLRPRQALGLDLPPKQYLIPPDATGIAFRRERRSAIDHGLNELFERWITASLWGGGIRWDWCTTLPTSAAGVKMNLFGVQSVPYCLAMCMSDDYVAFGAKVACSIESAIAGATAEAIMVFDHYRPADCESFTIDSYPLRHRSKMAVLQTANGRRSVVSHLFNAGERSSLPRKQAKRENFMSLMDVRRTDFDVVAFESPVGHCVRVLSRSTANLNVSNSSNLIIPML